MFNDEIKLQRNTSYDEDIDCLVYITKSEPREDRNEEHNHVQGNDLSERKTRNENNIGGRKKREAETLDTRQDAVEAGLDVTVDTRQFHKLIATEPLEMALVFCIMASLDARRKLPSLSYQTREFYRGPQLWDGDVCSAFLPKFFEIDTKNDTKDDSTQSNPRLFGPASITVNIDDRY